MYVFIDKKICSKLDAKITKLVFVGYINTSKGYRLWEPNTQKVRKIANVIFDETFIYNNFTPILAHSTKLLQVGAKQALTFHGSNTTSYNRSSGNTSKNRTKTTSYDKNITTSYCGSSYTTYYETKCY